ncbi:MAG: matrixin family metalloprotease [Pirellulales bacterium]|nr:matrixin family metalloprotease [Pirellulales bacterium]
MLRFRSNCRFMFLVMLGIGCWGAEQAGAEVAVLANRTNSAQMFNLFPAGERSRSMTLAAGDARAVRFSTTMRVRFGEGLSQNNLRLTPNSAYYFTHALDDGSLQLEQIDLGPQDSGETTPVLRPGDGQADATVISVKLLVDEDEPTHRRVWEPRLRQRVARASQILEAHCGVTLKVVAVDTWESDNAQNDFSRSMREFERRVSPSPAVVAIGFSSQYQITKGRVHMGGTRGVLYPYIMVKERAPNVRETERLELLVHELGHFLGASHSPEPQSVMRPLLSGGQQRGSGSRIQFDVVNTLLMAIVAEELRHWGAKSINEFSGPTRKRMLEIYRVLGAAMPKDPAAKRYQQLIGRVRTPPLVEDTRQVLRALVRIASSQEYRGTVDSPAGARPDSKTLTDGQTNRWIRRAATVALRIDSSRRAQALLLALGIFADNGDMLRTFPPTARFVRRTESEAERRSRVRLPSRLAMFGRQDLAKHFFVSAHSLVILGSAATRGAGLAKELLDARDGSGFSFADMAANRAGMIFAEHLLAGKISVEKVSQDFRVTDYMVPIADLAEGLGIDTLESQFGGKEMSRLVAELARIEERILELPAYAEKHAATTD